jgi:hypothetical protein
MTKDRTAFPHLDREGTDSRRSRLQGSMGESYMSNHSSKVCQYMVQSQK